MRRAKTPSSRSFESSPSTVTIGRSRRSRRPLYSSGAGSCSTLSAASCTSSGNVSARSYWRMTERTSTPGSPTLPSTSMTLPSALRRRSGHFVISTTTLLPVFAPWNAFFGTKISWLSFVLSGVTKPNVLLLSNVPTIFSFARSRMRMISPSRERPSSCAGVTRATTRSPCMAVLRSAPGTKTSVSSSDSRTSGMMKPKPLAVIERRPTTRCMRLGMP